MKATELDLKRMREDDRNCAAVDPSDWQQRAGPQAVFDRRRLLDDISVLSSEGALKDAVIEELTILINESHGVDGLHLNGDVADWDWLMNNQWLEKYAALVSEGRAPDA